MREQLLKWAYKTFSGKQSILVIATVRSGGTSMLNAIGDAYKQEVVFEPHTPMYKAKYNPYNSIVKNVIQNMSLKDHIDLAKKFDKVVLFDRRDIEAQASSYWHLWERLDGDYKATYVAEDIDKNELSAIVTKFQKWKDELQTIAYNLDQPIIYLEDVQAFLQKNVYTQDVSGVKGLKVSNFNPDLWYNPDRFLPYKKLNLNENSITRLFPHRNKNVI